MMCFTMLWKKERIDCESITIEGLSARACTCVRICCSSVRVGDDVNWLLTSSSMDTAYCVYSPLSFASRYCVDSLSTSPGRTDSVFCSECLLLSRLETMPSMTDLMY